MFVPTKAYKEYLKSNHKEPSIRIGKNVPKNAVNMAYYFNPTAADSERVLCAEAPRKTIDHRVEEAYKYLFDMPENNDDLFPMHHTYTDQEGYAGNLPRVWVRWKEKAHITEKNMRTTNTVVVDDKNEIPTSHNYEDGDGFYGNLFLDSTEYEVKDTKKEVINTTQRMIISNHELYKLGLSSHELNHYMKDPHVDSSSPWTKYIHVLADKVIDTNNNVWLPYNPYDGYTTEPDRPLVLISVEKDPQSGAVTVPPTQEEQGFVGLYKKAQTNPFRKKSYTTTAEINDFITLMEANIKNGKGSKMHNTLKQWKNDSAAERAKYTIEIYRNDISQEKPPTETNTYYLAMYSLIYKNKTENEHNADDYTWNVYANYAGELSKISQEIKEHPITWEATCNYTGIIRKVWYTYDGIAYYRGSIIKGDGIGNINPELNPDILMFPDEDGYLRRFDVNNNQYTRIDAEQFYITNVFKNNVPCFFEFKLSYPIYDYRGPDKNGFYNGDAVKVYTSNLKDISDEHKYQLKLKAAEYEYTDSVIDNEIVTTKSVKKYDAYLYSSFMSTSTNTFKANYNKFIEYDENENVDNNNNISEEIYNRPFMFPDVDYDIISVNKATRSNKIKLRDYKILKDTRNYITFEYKVIAYQITKDGSGKMKKFESNKRKAQILNKEYAVESEYKKFIDRAMIISPLVDGNHLSPLDIIIKDQALSGEAPIITYSNSNEFVFQCKPVQETINPKHIGAINITCNPGGSGVLLAETTLDTGFYNETSGTYTDKLILNNPYIIENGNIYPGYMVRCLDVRNVGISQPREQHLLESWYPLIRFGHYSQVMDQYGTHTKVVYSMPEYDEQYWGKYGKPYVDIKEEKAEILNSHMIKVKHFPVHIPNPDHNNNNMLIIKRNQSNEDIVINIESISFSDGVVITKEAISENDTILASYTYLEEYYVYRGFYKNILDYCKIDLNPNKYHTYSNLNKDPSELEPTMNLFNKTIYFYLRPTIQYLIDSENDDLINTDIELDKILFQNDATLYHTIDKYEPESHMDIYIGSVYIRQNTSLESTIIVDTRTRGGGLVEHMKDHIRRELEPESDFYLDIGCYDGTPYQENAVIIIRLDNSLLKEYGGRFTQTDIEQKVKKWLGLGVFPIIEFVDSYSKYDMPQHNLIVEDSYTNVIQETPDIILECIQV